MFRLVTGFILGLVAAVYTLPVLGNFSGQISCPSISGWFSDNAGHGSNTINSVPPGEYLPVNQDDFDAKIMTAISVSRMRDLGGPTSEYVIKLISTIADKQPDIRGFILDRLRDGLTNREALEIFERYYAIQG